MSLVERLRRKLAPRMDTDEIEGLWAEAADEIERLRAEVGLLRAVLNIDLDACAKPTPEQTEQMETGFGAIFTPRMALELGMKTAIGNVKRARAALENKPVDSK